MLGDCLRAQMTKTEGPRWRQGPSCKAESTRAIPPTTTPSATSTKGQQRVKLLGVFGRTALIPVVSRLLLATSTAVCSVDLQSLEMLHSQALGCRHTKKLQATTSTRSQEHVNTPFLKPQSQLIPSVFTVAASGSTAQTGSRA